MKLGISYMVFEGEELLEYAIKSIRNQIDFISVIYQNTSFLGQSKSDSLLPNLNKLVDLGLVDQLICYENDYSLPIKQNELNMRNLGVKLAKEAGCTHNISADVDEFYTPEQLDYVKKESPDCSIVSLINYYKHPCWQIHPIQGHKVTFIQKVDIDYNMNPIFPFKIEVTRRLRNYDNLRVFYPNEFVIHHMSYVRKDIRRKLENSSSCFKNINKIVNDFDKYKLGDRICMSPDYLNRKTILTPDIFKLGEIWEQHQ